MGAYPHPCPCGLLTSQPTFLDPMPLARMIFHAYGMCIYVLCMGAPRQAISERCLILAKTHLLQKGMSANKDKAPAASLKRCEHGLGLPIHIKMVSSLMHIDYHTILVLNRSLYMGIILPWLLSLLGVNSYERVWLHAGMRWVGCGGLAAPG